MLWPHWLEEDVPKIGLWLVGFEAAKTNWGGYGIPIADRANSVLERLLVEPDLTSGNIIFITHSLGGIVVIHMLRNADSKAGSNPRAKNFLRRVRRVAFLGTPHRGARLAGVLKVLCPWVRPSEAANDLISNSAQLRDLNYWYRQYSRANEIENLLLAEGLPITVLGISLPKSIGGVVSVDSADAGLIETPIVIDENHTGISKPASRDAEVYVHVRDFVIRPFSSALQVTRNDGAREKNTKEFQGLGVSTQMHTAAIAEMKRTIAKGTVVHGTHPEIIDAEVNRRLERLCKFRVFSEFDTIEETRSLVASLEEGDLVLASEEQKGTALAWCARFLSGEAHAEAASILDRMGLANFEASSIARSVVKASSGDLQEAIGELCAIGTPVAFGAVYISLLRIKGLEEANEWLRKAGLAFVCLDSDAKFFYIRKGLEEGNWDIAFNAAKEVEEEDCERSPGLFFATADAFLMQTVPEELRTFFLTQILPFEAANFPLRGEPLALEHRRSAIRLYKRLHSVAEAFGLLGVARLMDDKALWLRIMDPESRTEARGELEESIRNPMTFLRRLGLGLQFGVDIDLEWAEREVDRQTALSGGMSPDAAFAGIHLRNQVHSLKDPYCGDSRTGLDQPMA